MEKCNTEISNNLTETFAAARAMSNLTMCTDTTVWAPPPWFDPCTLLYTFTDISIANDLLNKLQENSFSGAVTGAVQKCFNNRDGNSQKCKLAAAAITHHDIKNERRVSATDELQHTHRHVHR